MDRLNNVKNDIKQLANPQKAKASSWFFKTKEGEYGYGDRFIGITVPEQRTIARKYKDLSLTDIERLLHSEIHEERLIALFILVFQFAKAGVKERERLFAFYIKNVAYINNWDLVDSSAAQIVGEYLFVKQDIALLERLAKSEIIWERRIAMVATNAFIKKGESQPTCKIAGLLLHDKHDLIHKAVGWMLREVGGRCSIKIEEEFLQKNYKSMPRTMLRYAIEKFPEEKRKAYLHGTI